MLFPWPSIIVSLGPYIAYVMFQYKFPCRYEYQTVLVRSSKIALWYWGPFILIEAPWKTYPYTGWGCFWISTWIMILFFFYIHFITWREKPSVCVLSELIPSLVREVTSRMVWGVRLTSWVSSQIKTELWRCSRICSTLTARCCAVSKEGNSECGGMFINWQARTPLGLQMLEARRWSSGKHGWALVFMSDSLGHSTSFCFHWWYQWKACLWK